MPPFEDDFGSSELFWVYHYTLLIFPASTCMGVSKNRGTPKWMVFHKMDDLGVPLFSETSV